MPGRFLPGAFGQLPRFPGFLVDFPQPVKGCGMGGISGEDGEIAVGHLPGVRLQAPYEACREEAEGEGQGAPGHEAQLSGNPLHGNLPKGCFGGWTKREIYGKQGLVMRRRPDQLVLIALLIAIVTVPARSQDEEVLDEEARKSGEAHMRDELGVNDVTAPSIAQILKEFDIFRPVPLNLIAENPRDAVFDNRLQTALHFGALVADGFMLTVAERAQDIQDVGRALIRQSRALGVSDRLTKRSKSLFEYSDKGNWQGMREELVRTQTDVEKTMLDLHDEQMAHMVSLGGWLRGFQLAANNAAQSYSADKARILARTEIMDYYLDRLDTLHPRLRRTELVSTMIAKIKELQAIGLGAVNGVPSESEVKRMRDIANEIEGIALGPVDGEGRIIRRTPRT